ncbi:hypothetical protein JXJ21_22865 [candidate division KSB1 bacterium]|nr:hypothetical protein [candidate division KSB1 bacterium]
MKNIFKANPSQWVQHTLNGMTLEEKVGQLLFSRAHIPDIEQSIKDGIVGGFYALNHVPAERIAELKALAKVPLLVAQDLEAGYTANSLQWSTALALGAIDDPQLAYDWANMQAIEARQIGVQAVFGPVLDIAMNPDGALCGIRALSGDAQQAASLGVAVVKGFQAAGMLPFAKHFPGFGRGPQDAHIELSVIDTDRETFYNEDVLPYRKAIAEAGLMGVMTGHIRVDCIDPEMPLPMSKKLMDVLKEIGFNGLAVTDSLAMKGILYHYPAEVLYPGAILSGHDMIIADYQTPDRIGFGYLLQAVKAGRISESMLNRKVTRLLQMKEFLNNVNVADADRELHRKTFTTICERAMTAYCHDGAEFEPIDRSKKSLFVVVSEDAADVEGELPSGRSQTQELVRALKAAFPNSTVRVIPLCQEAVLIEKVLCDGMAHEEVHVIAHATGRAYSGMSIYHLTFQALVRGLAPKIHTFVIWGNPFAAKDLPPLKQVLFTYDYGPWIDAAMKILTGESKPKGRLPVKIPSL